MSDIQNIFKNIINANANIDHLTSVRPPVIPKNPNLASEFYEHIMKSIKTFEDSLEPEFEVGAKLVSYGPGITIHINDIGYQNPSLITLYGKLENGDPVELIQHVTQINILLVRVKRDMSKPRRKIGLISEESESSF